MADVPTWNWLRAADASYDSRAELRQCQARSGYDAALLVTRLVSALEFGATAVSEDRLLGSPLWFHRSGSEGIFYLLEDGADGNKLTVVWVGGLRGVGFGEACTLAERRIAETK
jgi:hypothetical protein